MIDLNGTIDRSLNGTLKGWIKDSIKANGKVVEFDIQSNELANRIASLAFKLLS